MASLAASVKHVRVRRREDEFLETSAMFSDIFVVDEEQRGASMAKKLEWMRELQAETASHSVGAHTSSDSLDGSAASTSAGVAMAADVLLPDATITTSSSASEDSVTRLTVASEWLITRLCSHMCPFKDVRDSFKELAESLTCSSIMQKQSVSRFCSVPLYPVYEMIKLENKKKAARLAARREEIENAIEESDSIVGTASEPHTKEGSDLSQSANSGEEEGNIGVVGGEFSQVVAEGTGGEGEDDDYYDEDASTRDFLISAKVRQFVKSCKNGYPGAAWTKLEAAFGMHPRYFESELTTYRRLMTESGPLPATWRHYIAIMAASRYNCTYLVFVHRRRFLATGGELEWLEGLHRVPQKLARLADLNGVLAHRPWLLGAEDNEDAPMNEMIYRNEVASLLSGKNSYSKSELAHAIAVLATYHAHASFCHAMGIELEPEDEFDIRGVEAHVIEGNGSQVDYAADDEGNSGGVAAVAKAVGVDEENLDDSEIRNRLLRDDDPGELFGLREEEEEGDNSSSEGGADFHDALMMQHFSKIDVVSSGALTTAKDLFVTGNAAVATSIKSGSVASPTSSTKSAAFSCSIYCGENSLEYQDFEVGTRAYRTLRTQEYSWGEHAFALMDRFSSTPGASAAEQFDQQFDLMYDLTYLTFSDSTDIDTLPFRRAIWYYVLRLFGICHDDYEVSRGKQHFPEKN